MTERKLSNGMGSIKIDLGVGNELTKALSKRFVTRVGILGQKSNRTTITRGRTGKARITSNETLAYKTNAEIGLKHERGSMTEHIPRRSFLEVPLTQNIAKIDRMGKIIAKNMQTVEKGMNPETAFKKAHRDLGIVGEQIVQRAFAERGPGWPDNSKETQDRKGSDAPLIDSGQLRRSIMSDVQEKSKA